MKITKIDLFQVDLPYAGGTYTLSGGREYHSFDATIVRISALVSFSWLMPMGA